VAPSTAFPPFLERTGTPRHRSAPVSQPRSDSRAIERACRTGIGVFSRTGERSPAPVGLLSSSRPRRPSSLPALARRPVAGRRQGRSSEPVLVPAPASTATQRLKRSQPVLDSDLGGFQVVISRLGGLAFAPNARPKLPQLSRARSSTNPAASGPTRRELRHRPRCNWAGYAWETAPHLVLPRNLTMHRCPKCRRDGLRSTESSPQPARTVILLECPSCRWWAEVQE